MKHQMESEIIIVPKRSSWLATVLNDYTEPSTSSSSSIIGPERVSVVLHDGKGTTWADAGPCKSEAKRVEESEEALHKKSAASIIRALTSGPQFALPDYPEDGGDMSSWIPYIEADIVAMGHDLMAVIRKWGPEMFRYHEYCIQAEKMAIKDAKGSTGFRDTARKTFLMNEAATRLTRLHVNMNRIWYLLEPPTRRAVN